MKILQINILIIILIAVFMPICPCFALESTIIDNFSTLNAWSTRRDADRMKAEYSNWEMAVDNDGYRGKCLRMSFSLIASSADIWGTFNIEEPFNSLSIMIQNPNQVPGKFSITICENDGSMYVGPTVDLPTDSKWHKLEFAFNDFHVAPWSSDENSTFDFPLKNIIPVVSGVKQGVPVVIRLDELSINRPKPAKARLASVVIPKIVRAGQKISIDASIIPLETIKNEEAQIIIKQNGAVISRLPVLRKNWNIGKPTKLGPLYFKTPDRVWPGKAQIIFRMKNVKVINAKDGVIGSMIFKMPKINILPYSVKNRNGVPQIFQGNTPIPATSFMYELPNPDQIKAMSKAGIHLYWLECRLMGWVGPDSYDYSQVDEYLNDLFALDPNARVIPFFYVDMAPPMVPDTGDWWQKTHPDDLCIDDNGVVFERYGHKTVSFSSSAWRKDAGKALEHFILHLENSPYADRIAGYQPCAGGSYEWMYHAGQDSLFVDYSKPTIQAFQTWLKNRYSTSQNLQRAWKTVDTTFENAEIPLRSAREKSSLGTLRDPQQEQPVIDYYTFLSEMTADTIDYFCGIIKKTTANKKLAGIFYGYIMEQMYGGFCTQHTGHFALGKLLKSKNVDYLMSPTSYYDRQAGGGGGHMTAIASIHLHNKLWINQADIRTHLSDKASGYGRCDTEEQSIGVLRREYAMDLAAGVPVYWYSFSQPWFGPSKSIMSNIAKMNAIDKHADEIDRSPDTDRLAVIVSDSPASYVSLAMEPLRSMVYLQREALARSGVPYDVYLDSDLDNPNLPEYKAYLFLDSIHLTDKFRKWINDNLKKNNNVLAWVWAQGIAADTLSVENTSSLCGINLELSQTSGVSTVQPETGYGPVYKSEGEYAPFLYINDPSATTLGKYLSPTQLMDKSALGIKKYQDWTSFYSAALKLTPELIREIAKLAGLHAYSTGNDPIYVSRNYIGIHTKDAGTKTISLPKSAEVIDCFTDKTISDNCKEFTVNLDGYSTGLYRLIWK